MTGHHLLGIIWTVHGQSTTSFWVLLEDPLRVPYGVMHGRFEVKYVH